MEISRHTKEFIKTYLHLIDDLDLYQLVNRAYISYMHYAVIDELTTALISIGISEREIYQAKVDNCIEILSKAFEQLHNYKYSAKEITVNTLCEVYLLSKLGLTIDDVYKILSDHQSEFGIAAYEITTNGKTQKMVAII